MNKSLNYLGIARRAGYLISGTDAVIASIQTNNRKDAKAKLVIIASDASLSTKDKIINKCHFYEIEYIDVFSTTDIANAVGLENPKVLAITDVGIANQIKRLERGGLR